MKRMYALLAVATGMWLAAQGLVWAKSSGGQDQTTVPKAADRADVQADDDQVPLTITEVFEVYAEAKPAPDPCATRPSAATQPQGPVQATATAPCVPAGRIEQAKVVPLGPCGVPGPLEEKAKEPVVVAGIGAATKPGPTTQGGAPIPEPATLALLALAGAAGVISRQIHKKAKALDKEAE